MRRVYQSNPELSAQKQKVYRERIRREVLEYYGAFCACCKESGYSFLTIDHIKGDGAKHRRSLGMKNGGTRFYLWLRRNGFPKDFQVLCFNCNVAKHLNGICPHKKDRIA